MHLVKKYFFILVIVLISTYLSAQSFNGFWKGNVVTSDKTYTLEFLIFQNKNIIKGTLVKPETFAISDSSFNGSELNLKSSIKGFSYTGSVERNLNKMSGILYYNNKSIHVDLFRGDKELNRRNRLRDTIFSN